MPVVVVAVLRVKPESVDALRPKLINVVAETHKEDGCQLYALHETEGAFVFVEQWADQAALQNHVGGPGVTTLLKEIGDDLVGAPDIMVTTPIPAGEPAKGALVR